MKMFMLQIFQPLSEQEPRKIQTAAYYTKGGFYLHHKKFKFMHRVIKTWSNSANLKYTTPYCSPLPNFRLHFLKKCKLYTLTATFSNGLSLSTCP